MAKTPSLADTIKALKKGVSPAAQNSQTPKQEQNGKSPKKPEKKVDGRKNNKRHPNSGRKPGGGALARRLVRTLVQDHYTAEVEVTVKDPKTGNPHTIKKPRVLIAIDALFQVGVQNKDAHALDRYLNRALGKPPQPLVGDEDEDAIQVDLGVDRILDKAYGDRDDDEE